MLIQSLRSKVFKALQDNILFDSFRKRLNREGFQIRGQNVRQAWDRAVIEARVAEAVTQVRNPLARFRPDTTLAPKSMKHPFQFEYVVELEYQDSKGNTFLKPITIKTDQSLQLEEQWERAQLEGERLAGFADSDLGTAVTITPTKTLIGYYSV
tara:strand:+ start:243 stop:704 length:462 start_codon:yes stop_codon:yes gene_type:complete